VSEVVEMAVVGAGPAGLAASVAAAECDLRAVLIDACPRPGGQYFKQPPVDFGPKSNMDREGQGLLSQLADTGIPVLSDTVVWGIFPGQEGDRYLLCLFGPQRTERRVLAQKVILAPGAYDRPVPFPGWTLPGVMTAGAAQVLLKSQRVAPGKRVLLSGTGPLQLALASELVSGGAEVVAILDANPFPRNVWRHAGAVWGQWERLREGWQYWRTISKAGVPILWQHAVVRAEGNGQVERAVIASIGGGVVDTIEADTICLGYGFVPSAQLSRQAGAEHCYRSDLGTYVPIRDESLQTTLPGLFVAGDGAGIGGKDVALLEGRLAALAAVRQLGEEVQPSNIEAIRRDLRHQRRFASLLDTHFPFPRALWESMTDDTILCRCEEVTVGEVRQAIEAGATSPDAVKAVTRVGMGRCQGRMCSAVLSHVIARETGQQVETVGCLSPRPPVVSVPVDGLLNEEGNAR
jgi:NADPH-dependent 2,4-dienoyl-CoA reductase/sulfur reductase-like enzyme